MISTRRFFKRRGKPETLAGYRKWLQAGTPDGASGWSWIIYAVLAMGSASFVLTPQLDAADNGETRHPQLKAFLEIQVPEQLRKYSMERPEAHFLVMVNEKGKVTEALCLGATHRDLIQPGMSRAMKAKFDPGLRDGQPVTAWAIATVYFFDAVQEAWWAGGIDVPLRVDTSMGVDERFYHLFQSSFAYSKSNLGELDDELLLVEGSLIILSDKQGNKAMGECLVEFYIDPEGLARFPRILESDNELVSMSALQSLQTFRYHPPTRNGRETYVQVRQPFRFQD